jgi:RND family efflux transporter MFP subunit
VTSGDAVVTVTDVSQLSLSADVDENDVLLVHRGAEATVQLDALQNATYTAKVTGIGVTPKQSTGGGVTYTVTLSLERGTNPDGREAPMPKPGMTATVGLQVKSVHDVLSVPSSAVVTSGKDTTVWVRGPHGTAVRRTVRLGTQGDTSVEILSGLAQGERIVVKGADAIRPGQSLPAK